MGGRGGSRRGVAGLLAGVGGALAIPGIGPIIAAGGRWRASCRVR